MDYTLNAQNITHILPFRTSYEVFIVSSLEKVDGNIL